MDKQCELLSEIATFSVFVPVFRSCGNKSMKVIDLGAPRKCLLPEHGSLPPKLTSTTPPLHPRSCCNCEGLDVEMESVSEGWLGRYTGEQGQLRQQLEWLIKKSRLPLQAKTSPDAGNKKNRMRIVPKTKRNERDKRRR